MNIEATRLVNILSGQTGTFTTSRRRAGVTIEVEIDPSDLSLEGVNATLSKLFVAPAELKMAAPEYWQVCLSNRLRKHRDAWVCQAHPQASDTTQPAQTSDAGISAEDKQNCELSEGSASNSDQCSPTPSWSSPFQEARVSKDTKAPTVISAPMRIPSEAPRFHHQGTTTLWVVVDELGNVEKVSIASPVGFGLDDEAVRAVQKWRFRPATANGTPVKAQINVEVNW